jgi:OmcA/MtrC family decaheme c-type cytochrome
VPADLIVSFSAEVDGAAATAATFRRAYVSDGTVRTSLTDEIELDPTLFVNNGDGTYSVRIVDGVARFGGTNSRYLVVVLNGLNELEIAAVGDYPAAIPLAGLASSEACVGCHGESGEVGRFAPTNRGGHYSAPISADQCVVCHRPDDPSTPLDDEEPSYMRLVRVVHGIHNSHNFPTGEFVTDRGNAYNITYPTYMTNCSVCHSDSNIVPATGGSALAAANAMPVTGEGCFTCHGSMDGFDFTDTPFHLTIVDPETADCSVCHDGTLAAATVTGFHNGLTTGRGGIIWDGVDTSVTEGAKFDWEITGVVDDGTNLAISWQASYDGVGVDPCNDTLGPGAPTFHAAGDGNLSMLRNYAQGDDFILGMSTSAPGQALSVNVTVDNTTCAAGIATTTIPVDTVDASVDRGIVALQGKPRTPSPADPTVGQRVRAVTPTYEWTIGDGAPPVAMRRDIVDTSECLTCHVGSLYQHGGNRVDNVGMCILCHNSASNEQSVRVGLGVDSAEAYDGKVGETFEMKTMLHRIHSAGVEGLPPYVIYRNRGIYGFATDESLLPNWPGTGAQIVFGSEPPATINHNFHSADYPRALNACSACHVDGLPVQPDPTQAMATTVEAGSSVWEDQIDDVLQGATTTACVTCHADSASRGHAFQNGWEPQTFEEGRETIIDAAQ